MCDAMFFPYSIEIDHLGKIVSVNRVTLAYLGYSEEDIRSMTIFDILVEEDAKRILAAMAKWKESPKGATYDLTIRKRTGLLVGILVAPEAVLDEDLGLMGFKCVFREK